MMLRGFAIAFGVALALPAVPAQSRTIATKLCNGGETAVIIPLDPAAPAMPAGHDCCRKACHAGDTRRKRGDQFGGNCCG